MRFMLLLIGRLRSELRVEFCIRKEGPFIETEEFRLNKSFKFVTGLI